MWFVTIQPVFGGNISSTESYFNIPLGKAWTAIDKLSTIWKNNFSDQIKREVFVAVAV